MIFGLLLIVLSVVMMLLAKPRVARLGRFLRSEFLTEIYALTVITSMALGCTLFITGLAN